MEGLLWKKNLFGWLTRKCYERLWLKIQYIPDNQILWRCVYNSHQIKPDGTLKSGFFMNHEISVDIAILTTIERASEARGKKEFWIKKPGLSEFLVGVVRSLNLNNDRRIDVKHDPKKENPRNYAHGIFTDKLSRAQSKRLIELLSFPAGKTPTY